MEINAYSVFTLIAEDGRNNYNVVHQRLAKNLFAEKFCWATRLLKKEQCVGVLIHALYDQNIGTVKLAKDIARCMLDS